MIENTSYCHLHILNSRFAAALGFRRCAHRVKNKRCHRPVKVSVDDLPPHLRESDKPDANDSVVCGRHRNGRTGQSLLSRGRISEAFYDIPDSEGDSDSFEHFLQDSTVLSKRELAQVLKAKIEKQQKLYMAELNRTNMDPIRAERNANTKNISYHFLKQSLTGNEVIVAQMAKLERYRLYELPEDKIKQRARKYVNLELNC